MLNIGRFTNHKIGNLKTVFYHITLKKYHTLRYSKALVLLSPLYHKQQVFRARRELELIWYI